MSWSLLLAAVGVLGLWGAGRPDTRLAGWLVGLGAQALWVVYAVTTDQYGFLLSAGAYGAVYWRNVRRELAAEEGS